MVNKTVFGLEKFKSKMCIFKNRVLLFRDCLAERIVNTVNTSCPAYFKAVAKTNRNIRKLKTLITLKKLDEILSKRPTNQTKYLLQGNRCVNFATVPRPRFLYNVKIVKAKRTQTDCANDQLVDSSSQLTKSLFGLRIDPKDTTRSQIMDKIKKLYPTELRIITFAFAMMYIDSMDTKDLLDFAALVEIGSDDTKNPGLIEYISAQAKPPDSLIEGSAVFRKLLNFVSSTHPSLQTTVSG